MVKLFIDNVVKFDSVDKQSRTPLHLAAIAGKFVQSFNLKLIN